MSSKAADLKDIYLNIAGDRPLTEPQQEDPSHDPIDEPDYEVEQTVHGLVKNDGLKDAVDGFEANL